MPRPEHRHLRHHRYNPRRDGRFHGSLGCNRGRLTFEPNAAVIPGYISLQP